MKVFYLARINTDTEDATTRRVFEFCRQFSRMGHEVVLFVPNLGMNTLGNNGLRAVQAHFSWEAICKKIEAALEHLISQK